MDKRKARARKTEKESDFSAHIDFKPSLIDVESQASVLVQSTCNNRALPYKRRVSISFATPLTHRPIHSSFLFYPPHFHQLCIHHLDADISNHLSYTLHLITIILTNFIHLIHSSKLHLRPFHRHCVHHLISSNCSYVLYLTYIISIKFIHAKYIIYAS